MKTFAIPMIAIVDAEDDHAADELAQEMQTRARLDGGSRGRLLMDELLLPVAYNPRRVELHSIAEIYNIRDGLYERTPLDLENGE